MKSPNETEQELLNLTGAWARLAPETTFADHTLNSFKAAVEPSLAARARLAELRLDFERWLIERIQADEESLHQYQRVIAGIRCHAQHGNNSAMLRACGYVLEMERDSGLARRETLEEPPLSEPVSGILPPSGSLPAAA